MRIIATNDKCCKFRHKWVLKHGTGGALYSECSKCHARKIEGNPVNVRTRWLIGETDRIRSSPVKEKKGASQEAN